MMIVLDKDKPCYGSYYMISFWQCYRRGVYVSYLLYFFGLKTAGIPLWTHFLKHSFVVVVLYLHVLLFSEELLFS